MDLRAIDQMPSGKEKLRLWIAYGRKYNCLQEMPEIEDLYKRMKKEGNITREEFNSYFE